MYGFSADTFGGSGFWFDLLLFYQLVEILLLLALVLVNEQKGIEVAYYFRIKRLIPVYLVMISKLSKKNVSL